jgi:hypothetical protein
LSRGNALLSAKVTRAQQGDGRFFSGLGNHAEPDPAALDIENVLRGIALGKGPLFVAKVNNRSAQSGLRKKGPGVKVALLLEWNVDIAFLYVLLRT